MKQQSLKKNFLYNSLFQILSMALPFITAPYVSRVLGVENIGVFSYTYSIAGYFVLFALLGVKNYGSRSCARERDNKQKLSETFWNIFALQAILAVIMVIAYIVFIMFMEEYKLYFVICTIYVLTALFDISWLMSGLEQFKAMSLSGMALKILNVLAVFIFVNSKDDLWIYILIMVLGALLGHFVYWGLAKGQIDFVKPTWSEIKKHFKPNLVLFLPVVAVHLYKYMDKIMLGAMNSMTETGIYENAEKVINIPMYLITSLGTIMLPRMSNLAKKNQTEETAKLMDTSMAFVMFMGFAMTFGLVGIAKYFVPVYFGPGYEGCIPVMKMLAATIVFICWANVIRTQYLLPQQKDKSYIISVFAGAVVNLIINAILIPCYGAVGAAVGTIAAEVTVCVIQTVMVRRELPILTYLKYAMAFFVIGLIMYIVVIGVGTIEINIVIKLLLQIATGAVVYVVLSAIYLYFLKREMFNQMLKKFLP